MQNATGVRQGGVGMNLKRIEGKGIVICMLCGGERNCNLYSMRCRVQGSDLGVVGMVLKRDDSNGVIMLIPLSLSIYPWYVSVCVCVPTRVLPFPPSPLLWPPLSYSHLCTHLFSSCNPPILPCTFSSLYADLKKKLHPSR